MLEFLIKLVFVICIGITYFVFAGFVVFFIAAAFFTLARKLRSRSLAWHIENFITLNASWIAKIIVIYLFTDYCGTDKDFGGLGETNVFLNIYFVIILSIAIEVHFKKRQFSLFKLIFLSLSLWLFIFPGPNWPRISLSIAWYYWALWYKEEPEEKLQPGTNKKHTNIFGPFTAFLKPKKNLNFFRFKIPFNSAQIYKLFLKRAKKRYLRLFLKRQFGDKKNGNATRTNN